MSGKTIVGGWSELITSEPIYAKKLLANAIIRPTEKMKLSIPVTKEQDLATDCGIAIVVSKAQMVVEPLTRTIGLKLCRKKGIYLEDESIEIYFRDKTTASQRGILLEEIILLRYVQFGLEPFELLEGWPIKEVDLKCTLPNIIISGKYLTKRDLGKCSGGSCSPFVIKPHDVVGPDGFHRIGGSSNIEAILWSVKNRDAEKGFDPCVTREECSKADRTTNPTNMYHEKKGLYLTKLPKKEEIRNYALEAQHCVSKWKGKTVRIRVELPCSDYFFAPKDDQVVQISDEWNDILRKKKANAKRMEQKKLKEAKDKSKHEDIPKRDNKRKRMTPLTEMKENHNQLDEEDISSEYNSDEEEEQEEMWVETQQKGKGEGEKDHKEVFQENENSSSCEEGEEMHIEQKGKEKKYEEEEEEEEKIPMADLSITKKGK